MRVLHVIPAVWAGSGGPSRAVVELCRALHAYDSNVRADVATTDHGLTDEWRAHVVCSLPPTSALHVFPESKWLDPGWSLSLARWLWSHVRDYDVVHVHALFNATSTVAARIARRRRVPYIIRPLGTLSPYTFSNRRRLLKRLYYTLLDRPVLADAGAVHFTAPQEKTKAETRIPERAGAVVPLPFDASAAAMADGVVPARADDEILFLARLHPVKGLELLLDAFARLRAQGVRARLVIAGEGTREYRALLERRVVDRGLAPDVRFVGFVGGAEKRELLARATVFALPSHQENFGVAIVEALAAGAPVVISREVDIWPDVERFGSGLTVAQDVDSLANALRTLLHDETLRARCGAAGRHQVAELYSPKQVGAQLASLYARVAGAPGDDTRDTFNRRRANAQPPSRGAVAVPAPTNIGR